MSEPITREEYNDSIGRIHEKVNKISECVIEIATCSKMVKEDVRDMHKVIHGNGDNGLTNKITKLFERVSLHTKIIVGTVLAIMGGFVTLVFKLFEK